MLQIITTTPPPEEESTTAVAAREEVELDHHISSPDEQVKTFHNSVRQIH
ncbi:hypothetical protein QJS10_CPA01g01956 [Acorus calamus]|uniref:Uncharacterized protein n=1 Tax=Acorus calamus TaxID=4465 RepID=A0AAV9FJ02_ACOCL|nr:hypothetical protein QJS10_CPA01g01956 [Acorus calamus]